MYTIAEKKDERALLLEEKCKKGRKVRISFADR